jgi:hypothetical protein
MTDQEYRHALHLLNKALALFERSDRPESIRRKLRELSIELDLLRAGIRQVPAVTSRN